MADSEEPSAEALRRYLSGAAIRELDALRAAVDARLVALEAALAAPERHDSLEKLVFDLARSLTAESEAATARAVLIVEQQARERIEAATDAADRQAATAIANAESSARARAEEAESRAATAIADAEARSHAAIAEADARSQTTIAEAEARSQAAIADAEARSEAAAKQAADVLADLEQRRSALEVDEASARDRLAEAERTCATARDDVTAVRRELADAREATARLEAQLAEARQEATNLRRELDDERATLGTERDSAAKLLREIKDAQHDVDAERARSARLTTELDAERGVVAKLAEEIERARADAMKAAAEMSAERDALAAEIDGLRSAPPPSPAPGSAVEAGEVERQLAAALERIGELEAQLSGQTTAQPAADLELSSMLEQAPAPQQGVRRAGRYLFVDPRELLVDGHVTALVDLSISGAQVISTTALDEDRVAEVSLPSDEIPIRCKGRIVWTRVERASKRDTVKYRAGIVFVDADEAAIEAFIIRYATRRRPT